MAKSRVEEITVQLVVPIVENYGFELVDVEFKKEGADWYLRIFIDKPGGITVDDCEKVSRVLSDRLDEVDPIPQSYILEVSSPGIDRPLKTDMDFQRHLGEAIEIKLYRAYAQKKKYKGTLTGFDADTIYITTDNQEHLSFKRSEIATVKPLIKF